MVGGKDGTSSCARNSASTSTICGCRSIPSATYWLNEADAVNHSDRQPTAFNGFHHLADRLLSHKRAAGHAIRSPVRYALAQLQHLLDDRFEHCGNILAGVINLIKNSGPARLPAIQPQPDGISFAAKFHRTAQGEPRLRGLSILPPRVLIQRWLFLFQS